MFDAGKKEISLYLDHDFLPRSWSVCKLIFFLFFFTENISQKRKVEQKLITQKEKSIVYMTFILDILFKLFIHLDLWAVYEKTIVVDILESLFSF